MSRTQNDNRYIQKNATTALSTQTTIKSNQAYPLIIQNNLVDSGIFFEIRNNNGTPIWSVNGDGVVTKPRTPTQDAEVANKKYVDDQIAAVTRVATLAGGTSGSPSLIDLTRTVVSLSNASPNQRAYWTLADGYEGQEITLVGSVNLSNYAYADAVSASFIVGVAETWQPFKSQTNNVCRLTFMNGAWYSDSVIDKVV